jgi:hypothetical protein
MTVQVLLRLQNSRSMLKQEGMGPLLKMEQGQGRDFLQPLQMQGTGVSCRVVRCSREHLARGSGTYRRIPVPFLVRSVVV